MEYKKITVKHYLNERAKPKEYRKEYFYPLYVQIIVDAKKAQIKSRIYEQFGIYESEINQITKKDRELNSLILDGYFNEKQIDKIYNNQIFPLYPLLIDEIEVIKRIIILMRPFENKNFTLNDFSGEYEKHITEITDILDASIKRDYRENLNRIFHDTVDNNDEKRIFNISNYFIHYIGWNYSFNNFYETTFEVIPSELKYVENYLEEELLTAIKAYLAYHSKVNILKRYLDKKEKGLISTLSYLDWLTEIKEFILKEFTSIFGKKKATLYVETLDKILVREISGQHRSTGI
jgi:hypothetical protein